ncbi:MAG TPA: hypothetical protein VEL74_05765, partial [Thermoanaerobaculia bacterium]|nr:hypothetical protein [Thermoanaerobaculia bacterium]
MSRPGSVRRRLFLGVSAIAISLATTGPLTAGQCVKAEFLDHLETSGFSLEALDTIERFALEKTVCPWDEGKDRFCPSPGRYVVWRNNLESYWFPVPDAPSADRYLAVALRITARWKELNPAGRYDEAHAFSRVVLQGNCFPLGLSSGRGLLDQMEALKQRREQALQDQEALRELSRELADEIRKGEGVDSGTLQALHERIRQTADGIGKELLEGEGEGLGELGETVANAGGDEEPGEKGGNSTNGGEGVLPGSAPEWLQRVAKAVAQYFGVDTALESAALLLLLLEPELFTELADLVGGLSRSLVPDDLSGFLDSATELYDAFAAATALYETITSPESQFKDLVSRTGELLKALPEEVRAELEKGAAGEALAFGERLGQIAGAIPAEEDLALVEKLFSEEGRDAAFQELEKKVKAKIETEAETALAKALVQGGAELGIDLPAADLAKGIFAGEFDQVGERTLRAGLAKLEVGGVSLSVAEAEALAEGEAGPFVRGRLRKGLETALGRDLPPDLTGALDQAAGLLEGGDVETALQLVERSLTEAGEGALAKSKEELRAALCPPGAGAEACTLGDLPAAWRDRLVADARAVQIGNRRLFSEEEIAAIESGDLSGLAARARNRAEIQLEEIGLAPETARRVLR